MQKIVPYLWFDKNAEEAMNFYVEVFKGSPAQDAQDSAIGNIARYPGGFSDGPMAGMEGKILNGSFKLGGLQFYCLDGGPLFKFNESVSFYVACENQEEIDYFWGKLSAVPEAEQCGWLKDKFGLSWQIIPKNMEEMMSDNKSAINAMLKMKKIDITLLQNAKAV